jgi:hypothetical protein
MGLARNLYLLPSAPVEELKKVLPKDPAGSHGATESHRKRRSTTTRA